MCPLEENIRCNFPPQVHWWTPPRQTPDVELRSAEMVEAARHTVKHFFTFIQTHWIISSSYILLARRDVNKAAVWNERTKSFHTECYLRTLCSLRYSHNLKCSIHQFVQAVQTLLAPPPSPCPVINNFSLNFQSYLLVVVITKVHEAESTNVQWLPSTVKRSYFRLNDELSVSGLEVWGGSWGSGEGLLNKSPSL